MPPTGRSTTPTDNGAGGDNGSDLGDEPESNATSVIVQLTTYKKNGTTKKGKTTYTKDLKTKTIVHQFTKGKENYVNFLKAMLARHGKTSLMDVSATHVYPFKLQIPPAT
jgi:hypothetical protein